MKKIRIFKYLCMVFLGVSLLMCGNHVYAAEETFAGTKEITYTISENDMKHLCYSQEAGFRYALKVKLPDGMEYTLSHTDKTYTFSLVMKFDSFEEYYQLHCELFGEDVEILYGQGEGLVLKESIGCGEFTQYLDNLFKETGICVERDFSWFADYVGTKLTVNDKPYECDDKFDIKNEAVADVRYESMKIDIQRKDDKVVALVTGKLLSKDHEEDQIGEYIYHLKKKEGITCVLEGDVYEIQLEVEGESLDEVLPKIGSTLGMYAAVERSYEYVDSDTIGVVEKVNIISKQILKENAKYEYKCKLVGWFRGLETADEEVIIEGYQLKTDKQSCIEYKYIQDMYLDNLIIKTDVNDPWGKIKRSVTFQMPLELGAVCGENIINDIKGRLADGMVFTVYDSVSDTGDSLRNYEVTMESNNVKDIELFTQEFLGCKNSFEIVEGFVIVGKDTLVDVIKVDNGVLGMAGVNDVEVVYITDKGEELLVESAGITEEFLGLSYEFQQTRIQTWMFLGIAALVVVIVAIYVCIIVSKIKKLIRNKRHEDEGHEEEFHEEKSHEEESGEEEFHKEKSHEEESEEEESEEEESHEEESHEEETEVTT